MRRLFIYQLIIALNLFLIDSAISQGQTNQWFFGVNAGISFNTSPPSVITGSVRTHEGTASMCDVAGNLLFYTNGDTVYTRQHQIMVNGTGLGGDYSTSQSAMIIKKPGNNTEFYIFTIDDCGGPFGLSYSIVDMSLQSGMGQVTTKNVLLYAPTSEKIAAVRHCNNIDFWIITHKIQSDTFVVYQLSATGVNTSPVKSSVGSIHYQFCGGGSLKVSPNGRQIATGTQSGIVELFDFNVSSGVVSNQLMLENNIVNSGYAYGVEFSGDGTKLYAAKSTGATNGGRLLQWNLCAGSPTAVVASQFTVASGIASYLSSIQRGPDDIIYFTNYNQNYLGTIKNPNALGTACNFTVNGISIAPNTCRLGLPNFVADDVPVPIIYTLSPFGQTQNCSNVQFQVPAMVSPANLACTAPPSFSATNYFWIFGDPSSVSSNTSTLINPSHNYASPGTYTVKLAVNYATCAPDTFFSFITIPDMTLTAGSPTACTASGSLSLSIAGNYTYSWSPGSYSTTSISGVSAGIYTVSALGLPNGCILTKTVNLQNSVPNLSVSGQFSICAGAVTTLSAIGATTYSWSTGAQTSTVGLSPLSTSNYTVTGTSLNGCIAKWPVTVNVNKCSAVEENVEEVRVTIFPNPVVDILTVTSDLPVMIVIYDQLGRKVVEKEFEAGISILPVIDLSKGIYHVQIRQANFVKNVKMVKTDLR